MFKMPENVVTFYRANPEKLEQRKQIWREIFENMLRRKRPDKKSKQDFIMESASETEGEWLYTKHRMDIENESFTEEELVKYKNAEQMIEKMISFWSFPDEEDFRKLV